MEVISTMKVVKVSTVPELVESMQQYAAQIPKMDSKDVNRILIRAGVLDKHGKPKKQICTGSNYASRKL